MKDHFDPVAFGATIKLQRAHEGISIRDLAVIAQCQTTAIWRLENGKGGIGIETFFRLSAWLDETVPKQRVICPKCNGVGFKP